MNPPAKPGPERDDLARDLDRWEIGRAIDLYADGRPYLSSVLLARYERDWLEADMRKPLRLCVVTGI